MRGRLKVLAGLVAVATASGASAAVADEPAPGRSTGDDPAHAAGQDGSADPAAPTPVPLPDLGITHRLADGGMNLFRMPLSELEEGYGEPQLVRRLPASQGWRYDRSVVLAGDFGDITAGDDGTADHVIWHATADGSVKVWAIGGGSDTAPRLWHTLPRRSGWNWSSTRPVVGDVDGDGWDDLVVRHRATPTDVHWVMRSNGSRLGAPTQWFRGNNAYFATSRDVLADVDGDGGEDLIAARSWNGVEPVMYLGLNSYLEGPSGIVASYFNANPAFPDWTLAGTRMLPGYWNDDDIVDLLTVTTPPASNGLMVLRHLGNPPGAPYPTFSNPPSVVVGPPHVLDGANGWSFPNSRHHVADTNGDYLDDLITVHRGGGGGFLVWRHLNDGTGFAAAEVVADLRTGGWRWGSAREGVADTWGLFE